MPETTMPSCYLTDKYTSSTAAETSTAAPSSPTIHSMTGDLSVSNGSDNDAPPQLEVGEVIDGRWQIEEQLSSGQQHPVYHAYDRDREQSVALKFLPSDRCRMSTLYHDERDALRHLPTHPHLIQVYDIHQITIGSTSHQLVSMEWAASGTLRDWLGVNCSDLEQRRGEGLSIWRPICHGVSSLHDAGLVHLDIKPDNIFLCDDGPKLGDFGCLTQMRSRHAIDTHLPSPDSGRRFASPGTAGYRSPEAYLTCNRAALDTRADVYSLGLVLLEIMSPNASPRRVMSDSARLLQYFSEGPCIPHDLDNDLCHLLRSCLEIDPDRRYADAKTLLGALNDIGIDPRPSRSMPVDDTTIEKLWQSACRHAQLCQYTQAISICDMLLRIRPDHQAARQMKGDISKRHSAQTNLCSQIITQPDSQTPQETVGLLNQAWEQLPGSGQFISTITQMFERARTAG